MDAKEQVDEPRLRAMKEFAERQGWVFRSWTGTQREPGDGVSIRLGEGRGAIVLRSESHDGQDVAVARMEQALAALGRANSDAYLHDKHSGWGQV